MSKRKIDATEQVNKFLADVLATVPEASRAAVKEALELDGVKTVVKDRVLARSDYSAAMDEAAQELSEGRQKITEWTNWYGTASTEFATTTEALKTYEERFGKLDGSKSAVKPGMTKEEVTAALDEMLQPRDAAAIDVADLLTDLKLDYRDQFKEKLDSKALIKFAMDNRLPLNVAYSQFVAPKVEELRKKEFDVAITKAKEDGAREYATSHKMPVMPMGNEASSWERPKDLVVGKSQTDRVAAAVAGFQAGGGS